jgi:hypothetical protein
MLFSVLFETPVTATVATFAIYIMLYIIGRKAPPCAAPKSCAGPPSGAWTTGPLSLKLRLNKSRLAYGFISTFRGCAAAKEEKPLNSPVWDIAALILAAQSPWLSSQPKVQIFPL